MIPIIDTEFKLLIPPLSYEERIQLEQNILYAGKCHDAIILWDGVIIDGHNRFEICMKHEIEFEVKHMAFDSREEAKIWILGNQLARRNLNEAARIELVLKKEDVLRERASKKRGGRPKKSSEKPSPEMTTLDDAKIDVQKALAAEANVSVGNFSYYMDIRNNGSPELIKKVQSGEIKIGTAHRLLPKQLLKEMCMADKMYKSIAQHASAITDEATRAQIRDGLDNLALQLQNFINMPEERRPEHVAN